MYRNIVLLGEGTNYSPKELKNLANMDRQELEEHVWAWILRMMEWEVEQKLDKEEFIDKGAHFCDLGFGTLARTLEATPNTLLQWLPGAQR